MKILKRLFCKHGKYEKLYKVKENSAFINPNGDLHVWVCERCGKKGKPFRCNWYD